MKRYNSVPQIRCLHFLLSLKPKETLYPLQVIQLKCIIGELSRAKEEVEYKAGVRGRKPFGT